MDDFWRRQEQARSSRNKKKCMQPCSMQPAFTVLVKERQDCEELKPKSTEKWIFGEQEKGRQRSIRRSGV